jgi:hypothetical protein
MGVIYENGVVGLAKDPKKAREYFKNGAFQGDIECSHKFIEILSQEAKASGSKEDYESFY